jgi:cephalosporin-C deacetylase-like acetyl esterase
MWVNGKTLIVTGGSQGGALSIATAGLDSRVTGLASFYPVLVEETAHWTYPEQSGKVWE